MTGREWQPGVYINQSGDWATVDEDGVWRWVETGLPCLAQKQVAEKVRPLVVIDPEDRDSLERLLDLINEAERKRHPSLRPVDCGSGSCWIDAAQAALREFADPKPPKPEEPTGLGAVVECADGATYVRTGLIVRNPWTRAGFTSYHCWADIDASARVLADGVTS